MNAKLATEIVTAIADKDGFITLAVDHDGRTVTLKVMGDGTFQVIGIIQHLSVIRFTK